MSREVVRRPEAMEGSCQYDSEVGVENQLPWAEKETQAAHTLLVRSCPGQEMTWLASLALPVFA